MGEEVRCCSFAPFVHALLVLHFKLYFELHNHTECQVTALVLLCHLTSCNSEPQVTRKNGSYESIVNSRTNEILMKPYKSR